MEGNADGHLTDFERFGRVTSSVTAAILGHSTQSQKWAWRVITGREPYRAPSYDMVRGIEHEPDAVASLEIDLGVLTEEGGFVPHPTLDWLGASPDAIIVGEHKYPVEAKCPRALHTYVPLMYFDQIQVQLECLDSPYGYFVSWVEDSDAQFVRKVERSKEWADMFLPKLEAFHRDYVLTDIEPPTAKRGTKINGKETWDTVLAAVAAEAANNTTTTCLAPSGKTRTSATKKTPVGKGALKSRGLNTGPLDG
jgi:hypothetical protein